MNKFYEIACAATGALTHVTNNEGKVHRPIHPNKKEYANYVGEILQAGEILQGNKENVWHGQRVKF